MVNNAADRRETTPKGVFEALSPMMIEILQITEEHIDGIDLITARDILQVLGFLLCTTERHFQKQGNPPGLTIILIPQLGDILLKLSKIAAHPPTLQHYGYWLWNRGPTPITFTGDPQEVLFMNAVVSTADLHSQSNDAIRPICEEEIDIASEKAADALQFAAENTDKVHGHYCSLMRKNGDQRAMEPLFFMTKLRDNLVPCRVGSKVWSAANAANHIAQMQQDFLSGTYDSDYFTTVVTRRMQFLTKEDRDALTDDMLLARASVPHRFLNRMKMSETDVLAAAPADVVAAIARQGNEFRKAMAAYMKFFDAVSTLTAKHWAQIKMYLERAAKNLTPEQISGLAVKPTHGTGGMSHGDTEKIMRMRIDHPLITKLKTAYLTLS